MIAGPPPLVADNLRCLEQGIGVLESLSDGEYAALGCAGVQLGPQFRHVLDHYRCLLAGLACGVVDYDARGRDPGIEADRGLALADARALAARLAGLTPASLDAPLLLRARSGANAEGEPEHHPTSPPRELQFVLLHTVHHYALIALELRLRGRPQPDELGVAPATLGWRQR